MPGGRNSVLLVMLSMRLLIFPEPFHYLGVQNRRRNAVRPTGPFAQIDQAAAIAAERKMLVLRRDNRPATRASQNFALKTHHQTPAPASSGSIRPLSGAVSLITLATRS